MLSSKSPKSHKWSIAGVDGPPTGDRPQRPAGRRRAEGGESATARSALDKGRYAGDSRVKYVQEQDRSYTAALAQRRSRNPCDCAKRGARWASRKFVCMSGGGNVTVVMGAEEAIATVMVPRRWALQSTVTVTCSSSS